MCLACINYRNLQRVLNDIEDNAIIPGTGVSSFVLWHAQRYRIANDERCQQFPIEFPLDGKERVSDDGSPADTKNNCDC